MNPFQAFQAADSALLSAFGETVQYSRPVSAGAPAIAAFPIQAILDTGGQYADPNGAIFADVFLQTPAIPGGPQKNDLVLVANPTPLLAAGSYRVQEIFPDGKLGSAHLKVRWMGLPK